MFHKRKKDKKTEGVIVPQTKPQKLRNVRKLLSLLLTISFCIGVIGGARALSLQIPQTISNEVDMFVLDYISTKYEVDVEDKDFTVERKTLLEKKSLNFVDTIDASITISKVTNNAIKSRKVLRESKEYIIYEYIVLIHFAYRTVEDPTTMQMAFSEKIEVVQDKGFGGYTITLETPHDYTIATGMQETTKKAFDTYQKDLRELDGESMNDDEKGVYKDALKVFFNTYSTSLANAQSLVSSDVYLAELTGVFDTDKLELLDAKQTQTKVSFILQIPYTIEGVLQYKKTYKVIFENRTIQLLEEL